VEVHFDPVGVAHSDALDETAVQPRPLLGNRTFDTMSDQGCDRTVHVAAWMNRSRSGKARRDWPGSSRCAAAGTLQHAELDAAAIVEPSLDLQQAQLELLTPQHQPLVKGRRLLAEVTD